jgi:ATP-dependent helicase HrpA
MAEPFQAEFSRAVRDIRGVDIPDDAWDEAVERLPKHLRMTFRVEETIVEPGRNGRSRERVEVLGESTDLISLQRLLADRSRAAVQSAMQSATQTVSAESPHHSEPHAPRPPGKAFGAETDTGTTPKPTSTAARADTHLPQDSRAITDSVAASLPRSINEQPALSTWPGGLPDGILPAEVATQVGALTVRGYPGIVQEGAAIQGGGAKPTVALRVLADRAARDDAHPRGVRRLLTNEAALGIKRVTSRWTGIESLTLAASPYPSTEALVADLQFASVWALTAPDAGAISSSPGSLDAASVRDADTYTNALAHIRAHLEDEVYALVGRLVPALAAARDIDVAVANTSSLAMLPTLTDVRDHKAQLLTDGFLTHIAPERVRHLARYLKADLHRLEKAPSDPNRDAERMWQLRKVKDEVADARAAYAAGKADPARAAQLDQARWMVEELRVSLFAQQLGTDGPVSDKRIRKLLQS